MWSHSTLNIQQQLPSEYQARALVEPPYSQPLHLCLPGTCNPCQWRYFTTLATERDFKNYVFGHPQSFSKPSLTLSHKSLWNALAVATSFNTVL